ncbi:hypothetical protein BHE74_00017692 [Ensete ventricosum]|nr:hypothetical protein BHE74_00017692 [Ensete ventricosum]
MSLLSLSFPHYFGVGRTTATFRSSRPCFCLYYHPLLQPRDPFRSSRISITAHATRIVDLGDPLLHHRCYLSFVIIAATHKPFPSSPAATSLLPCLLLCCRCQSPLPCSLAASVAAPNRD